MECKRAAGHQPGPIQGVAPQRGLGARQARLHDASLTSRTWAVSLVLSPWIFPRTNASRQPPANTLALLQANAVVGLKGFFDGDRLSSIRVRRNLAMHGQGTFYDPRVNDEVRFPVAARAGFGNVRPDRDPITAAERRNQVDDFKSP